MTFVGAAVGAAGGRKAMKEKTITVSHEVSPEYGKCSFGGDFWGEEVCKYTHFVPRHTEIRHCRNTENPSACYLTAGSKNPTRSVKHAEKRAERRTKSESCPYQHQAQVV